MKGFFRRDLYLILPNVKFYVVFILFMGVIMFKSQNGVSFVNLYVAVFASSTLMGLFNYDMQGWQSYAMATPEGRRRQVQGRYVLSLLVMGVAAGIMSALALLRGRSGEAVVGVFFGAGMLLYTSLLLPVSYRFGNRSRIVMIAIIGITAGIFGAVGSAAVISGSTGAAMLTGLGWAVPAAGVALALAALWVSYRISRGIMERKEL